MSRLLAQAKERLRELEDAHGALTENARDAEDDLQCVADELGEVKRKMDDKASHMTDATPLVDIRAAVQRLRKENSAMNVRLGVLDFELSAANQQRGPDEDAGESDGSESDGCEGSS